MGGLTYAVRRLLRTPVATFVIVLTLALGIGAPTTLASVVRGVLLRPLAFGDQERLVTLWQEASGVGVAEDWFSPAQYFDLRERVDSFESSTLIFGANVTLTSDEGEPQRLGALTVSSSFFDVLGVQPSLGTPLSPEDDLPNAPRRVLLAQGFFQGQFGGDPEVVGRAISVDGERLEVIGVLPPLPLDAEMFPTLVTIPKFDLVMSLPIEDPQVTTHGSENYNIIAKLRPDATAAQLAAELQSVAELFVQDPGSLGAGLEAGSGYRIRAVPLLEQVVGHVRLPLLMLLGATALLLVTACATVASLLLTRAATRRREMSIRAALGADRSRLLGLSMLESVMMASVAGVAGVLLAEVGVRALLSTAPPELPRLADIHVDGQVLAFAAFVCLGSSLLFGLGPAWRVASVAPTDALREGATAVRARSLWKGGSRYLVIVQVALSLVLICGAGLLIRSFLELRAVDPGFRSEGVLSFRLSLTGERYQERADGSLFFEGFFEQVRALPGVEQAGGISMLPLTRGYVWTDFFVEGYDATDERDRIVADVHIVSPGYFEAMSIPLLAGRGFERADGAEPPGVIVNESFARRFWSLDESVGKWLGRDPEDHSRIVGVVGDVKHYGLGKKAHLTVFYPHRWRGNRTLYGVARSLGDASTIAPAISDIVRRLDPDLPVYDVTPMSRRVLESTARERILMTLLNVLGAIALILATVGLYGMLSFSVATQTQEIGIRKALGAGPGDLYRHVLRGAGAVTLGGIALGLAVAAASARMIEGLVYGVASRDPLSFAAATLVVVAVAVAASLLPARRAARVDPVVALRAE